MSAVEPAEFAVVIDTLVGRLPALGRAVRVGPGWRPADDAGARVPVSPAERAPIYIGAASLLDEVGRGASRFVGEMTAKARHCAVGAEDSDLEAARWLYRLGREYARAYPRPRFAALVADASKAVVDWDSRAAHVLGELLAPYPIRDEVTSRPVRCPAYPRMDDGSGRVRCGAKLFVHPDPRDAHPTAVACEGGGHQWRTPREWYLLGEALAAVPRSSAAPAVANVKVSSSGYGGRA